MPSNFTYRRQLPTKTPWPVDPDFEANYIKFGIRQVEHMYGKNRANRWRLVVGFKSLAEKRRAYLAQVRECER